MRKKILIPAAILGTAGLIIGYMVFGGTVNAPAEKYFYIPTGSNYEQVFNDLKAKNILGSTAVFDKLAKQANYHKNVKPGRYEIKDGSSVYSLVRMLKSGNQAAVKLVINKLRTTKDLASKIGKSFETDSASVLAFLNNKDSLANLQVDSNTAMSMVIPNTYEINWNSSLSKIFGKLKKEETKFWNEERSAKAKQKGLNNLQAYIIASIVEEETNMATDKPLVASVYINRFKRGNKLEADPTVKFAMQNFELKRVLLSHLKTPSPYNTYYKVGLPPGPICTPSTKTIDAVLNAPETNYMFFVAKPDFKGYSNFAETYEQHQIFAKQYQQALDKYLIEKKQKAAQQ
jgi:UPF0755 protein